MSAVVLRAAGVCLVLDPDGPGLPRVLHWGADLGSDAGADVDALRPGLPLLPAPVDGWRGRPAISGAPDGAAPYLRLTRTAPVEVDGGTVGVLTADDEVGITIRSELTLDPQGVVRVRHTLTNTGAHDYRLAGVVALLPLPDTAGELLDFGGRWLRERSPQRAPLREGTRLRENHRNRSGFDSAGTLLAGTPGFGFRHGEVWATHVGWSGSTVTVAERLVDAPSALGGGELLEPGEIVLEPGESYAAPEVWFGYAPDGMDGLSARLHASLRARPSHPHAPRPMTFNTWEAVYFDLDAARLRTLAELAAGIGVERFVLDDGWFGARRDDTAGLGDWIVSRDVWPSGLHPLVDHVHGLGMQFGLWVEPEMVNLDSDVMRTHPDWALAASGRLPAEHRHQHVLDLARPDAYAHVLGQLDSLLTEYRIDYLKWDHNREPVEPVHRSQGGAHGGVHAQTTAAYRLINELRSRHPGLEIESCASGGGRVDLGVLARTDRVWASDCTDPVERQAIQRWTSLLLPLELIGAHVSAPTSPTTGRTTGLPLRAVTALFGHAGIEWDISTCTDDELQQLQRWIGAYRRLRPLLHTGTLVRVDSTDAAWTTGVVGTGRARAVFAHVALGTDPDEGIVRLRLPALDEGRRYRVSAAPEIPLPATTRGDHPDWLVHGITASGRTLAVTGLDAVRLLPHQALLLDVTAE